MLRGQRGRRPGRQGIPLSLHTQEPRDGGCPQKSTRRRARRQESRGAATTISRTTFASHPLTKVPAPPRRRRCHVRHNNPELQPASSHRNQRHSNQNRGRRAPKTHRAEERCPTDLLGAPGVGSHDPAYAREKDIRSPLDDTSDELPKLQVEEPTSSGQNCCHRAPNAHRHTVDLLLHAPGFGSTSKQTFKNITARTHKCRKWKRPGNTCQKVTVYRKLPWWNLRRGAKLRGLSAREPCHEKSKSTGAAVG